MTARSISCWLVFTCVFVFAHADTADAVRVEFQRAYAIAVNASSSEPETKDSDALRGYILYPYLEQARLRHALAASAPDFPRIDRDVEVFLAAHDAEAVSLDLRRAWYASLAKRQEWARLLANYRDINDPILQCNALTARVLLQKFDGLQALAIAAWSGAPESRPACEPVFTWLKSQNLINDVLIEKRARLALASGSAAFARQMTAMLPKESAEPLNNWAALIERPRAALDALIADPKKPIEFAALFDGWTRFARNDTNGAIARYKQLVQARALTQEQASRLANELALALAWNRRPEALQFFALVRPSELDERGAEWSARAALWNGNWKRAAAIIDAMPQNLRQQTKWRYWSARVAELRGSKNLARKQYAALLTDDNYYAALASGRLGKPYTPNPHSFDIDETEVKAIANVPALARALELIAVDINDLRASAYDEWRRGMASLMPAARVQAIALAARAGWYDQAILTASQQGKFDDYELLYPHPFDGQVKGAANIVRLPEGLIYATLRQESLYRVDAQSSAGARGLMQLIDETATRTLRHWPDIAKTIGSSRDLFDPTVNIYVGAAKLRDLVDRFGGKVPVALAAYNAGPLAAERWLPNEKKDIDIWIENIPYNETRVYVQRILWHSVVFGWLATHREQATQNWLVEVASNN